VVRAAVLSAAGAPVRITDVTLAAPGPAQVRVRLAAAGVCHSDLSAADGTLAQPVPAVLGHEAAGVVTEVGADVDTVRVGDPVVLNWAPACRRCWFCSRGEPHLCEHALDAMAAPYATLSDGTPVYPGLGTAAFAAETVVSAAAVVPAPAGLPLELAALLGCAVLTGVGAVTRTAGVRPGESVAVLGLGGVGLSAVQGARLAGASPVVALDRVAGKEDLARRAGADAFVLLPDDPSSDQTRAVAGEIRRLTAGRGVDCAVECIGSASTIRTAWSLTRRGGQCVVVGIGRRDDLVSFGALELFHFARSLVGCVYGSADPARDIPLLAEWARTGELQLDLLVTDRIGLDDLPAAFDRLRSGIAARSLVLFDQG
jgi:S-(hydroxymethyl)glutathione dehydrogenase/alcohol dehydrogenase